MLAKKGKPTARAPSDHGQRTGPDDPGIYLRSAFTCYGLGFLKTLFVYRPSPPPLKDRQRRRDEGRPLVRWTSTSIITYAGIMIYDYVRTCKQVIMLYK